MSIPTSLRDVFIGANAAGGPNFDLIENSLRFRATAGNQLQRTQVTATNANKVSWSAWVKMGAGTPPSGGGYGGALRGGGNPYHQVLYVYSYTSGGSTFGWSQNWGTNASGKATTNFDSGSNTGQQLRDFSGWYHLFVRMGSATGNGSMRMYVNGQEIFYQKNDDVSAEISRWQYGVENYGNYGGSSQYWDGYLAEVHMVDGQELPPTDFGQYDENGVWIPKVYTGTYGNNFTPSGFELSNTSSSNYDWTTDSPTNNTPTINPLINDGNTPTISEANQRLSAPSGSGFQFATVPLPKSGKWYFEYEQISGTGGYGVGLCNSNGGGVPGFIENTGIQYRPDGTVYLNGSLVRNVGWSGSYVGLEVDMDNYQVEAFIGGSSFGGKYNLTTGLEYLIYVGAGGGGVTQNNRMNFGQRAFSRTPTSGYIPLRTAEIPAVDIKDPSDYFQTVLDTGANILSSAQSTFSNGLWWIKDRANSNQHQFVDSVRGSTNALTSPNDVAESTYSAPSGNSVAWCWSAPEAWSNSAGSNGANIASSGRRNLDAGFSIVNYSGRRPTSSTLAHGLNQAPEFIICKTRNTTYSFHVHHKSIGSSYVLILDTSQSKLSSSGSFSSINSSTFTVGNDAGTNEVGTNNMIAWCWHSVPGYSRFGSYVGNANSDGPFVYCGFRPAFVMIKITSSSGGWSIFDTSRDTYNPALKTLKADEQTQEQSNSSIGYDLVSNGFKIRTSNSDYNSSGGEFIYMAFAEHPFGGSNVYPTPAR